VRVAVLSVDPVMLNDAAVSAQTAQSDGHVRILGVEAVLVVSAPVDKEGDVTALGAGCERVDFFRRKGGSDRVQFLNIPSAV